MNEEEWSGLLIVAEVMENVYMNTHEQHRKQSKEPIADHRAKNNSFEHSMTWGSVRVLADASVS